MNKSTMRVTAKLAKELHEKMGSTPMTADGINLAILNWMLDNDMRLVKKEPVVSLAA